MASCIALETLDTYEDDYPSDETPLLYQENSDDDISTSDIDVQLSKEPCPYKMLLVGATGSGKTSFVNLCAQEKPPGGKFKFENIHSFDEPDAALQASAMASETTDTKSHSVEIGELKLVLIDTPGFGDTRGTQQDEENLKKIIATVEKEEFINCVCLVINGRQARMTSYQKYVLEQIAECFPREISDHIIVVFSNTLSPMHCNFKLKEVDHFFDISIAANHAFYIDNPYSFFEKLHEQASTDSADITMVEQSFDSTMQVLNKMSLVIKEFQPVHTCYFTFEKNATDLITSITNRKQLTLCLKSVEENLKTFNMADKTLKIVVTRKTTDYNTLCNAEGCFSTCHRGCQLKFLLGKNKLRYCVSHTGNSPGNEYCQKKPCTHHYSKHFHARYKFKEQIIAFNDTELSKQLKQKLDTEHSSENKATRLLTQVKRTLGAEKGKIERLCKELLQYIEDLEQRKVHDCARLFEDQLQVMAESLKETLGQEAQKLKKKLEELISAGEK